jgi:hypothetical protein
VSFKSPERTRAIESGEAFYFTGKSCSNGHIAKRNARSGGCIECMAVRAKRSRQARKAGIPAKQKSVKSIGDWRREASVTGQKQFFTGLPCRKGHIANRRADNGFCVVCAQEKTAKWRVENHGQYLEQMRLYAAKNSARNSARAAAWARSHPVEMRAHRRNWKRNNPGVVKLHWDRRQLAEIAAMPIWLTSWQRKAMNAIYQLAKDIALKTGIEHHVDHIVPLISKKVCGLHVPWNLQVIPGSENCHKSNKF